MLSVLVVFRCESGFCIRTLVILNATQSPRALQLAPVVSGRRFYRAALGIQPTYGVLFFKLTLPIDICSPCFSLQQRLMPVRLG